MAKILKYFGIFSAVIVGLFILTVTVINLIPGDTYKGLISSAVQSATGRELKIEGDLDIKLLSTLSFKASTITFANAEWSSRPHMASINDIEVDVALFPLLKGIIDVSLLIDAPDLLLETESSGRGNWQFAEVVEKAVEEAAKVGEIVEEINTSAEEDRSGGGFPMRLRIRQVVIQGNFAYLDGTSAKQTTAGDVQLIIKPVGDRLTIDFSGKFNDIPLALSGGFDNGEFFADNQSAPVSFDGYFGDVKLAIQGTAGPLTPTFDLDVSVNLESNSVADFSPLAGQDLPDIGPLALSAKLTGKDGKYAVSDLLTTLDDKTIQADIKASVGDLAALSGLNLEANISTDQLTDIARTAGFKSDFSLPDSLHAAVIAEGSLQNLIVTRFQTTVQGQGLNVDVTAQVENVMTLTGISADIVLNVESLDYIAEVAGTDLPPLGSLQATATISSTGEQLEGLEIKADVNTDDIHADVTGSIQDPIHLQGVNSTINLVVDSMDWLADYLETELPPLGAVSASAEINSKGDTFELKEIKVEMGGDKLHAKAVGSVADLLQLQGIDARIDFGLESLAVLSGVSQTELPPLGPLSGFAAIASKDDTFEVKEMQVNLADEKIQAKVAASVADVMKLVGINADINFSVDSLASLDDLVQQELPASGPVTLAGTIKSKGGLKAPALIDTVIKSDGFKAAITGSIAEPLAANGIDLALSVEAESVQDVGKLTGVEFVSTGPMKLAATFTSNRNSYRLSGLHLQSGELDVKGEAAFQQPVESGERPQVSAALQVGKLDFRKRQRAGLEKAEETGETQEDEKGEGKADDGQKKKVFSSDPLPWGPLREIDADIELTVETLKTLQFDLEQVIAELKLDNGLLTLKPLAAKVGNGTFGGSVTLDARNSPASLAADIELSDATFRDFGGTVNFLVDLEGSGNSVAEIMAGLDGQLQFDVRDVTLKKSLMTGFGSGMLDSLNPFSKDEEDTELICAIILFNIENGLADADKTIAAQMTDVTWFGSGEINLKTEEIDFGMNPKPRKGLGVSLGSLAKLAHLGGTLAEPKIELDPKDVAKKYGKYSAAVATGGLTILADLVVSKVQSNTDVCANILKELDKIQDSDEQAEMKVDEKMDVKTDVKTEDEKSKKRSLFNTFGDFL